MDASRMMSPLGLASGPEVLLRHRCLGWRPAPLLPFPGEHEGAGAGEGEGAGGEGEGEGEGQGEGTGKPPARRQARKTGSGSGEGEGHKPFSEMTAAEKAAHYGYPANTPVANMTQAQQVGYYRQLADKHEGRARQYDGLTPEALADLKAKAARADELDLELASDTERAVIEATKAAEKAAAARFGERIAAAEVRAQLKAHGIAEKDDIDEILGTLNLSTFLTKSGDDVDSDKVERALRHFGPGKGVQRQGPPPHGQGNRQQTSYAPGDRGRAEAEKRYGKPAGTRS